MLRRRKGPDRLARIATALAALALLATFVPPDTGPPPPRPPTAKLVAEPVPLDRADPARRRIGPLLFLEGWRISSRDVRFGGISAMHVENGTVRAVSDAGSLFAFPVPTTRAGPLQVRIERIAEGPGSGRRKSDRDGESFAVAGGSAWIAFEGRNEIWRYRLRDWRADAHSRPAAMEDWPSMRGPEAMARLQDGRFLVLAEGPEAEDGTTPVLLFAGDPAEPGTPSLRLRYRPPPGFRATDAALLPDGRLLVLNRRFRLLSGFTAALAVADISALGAGGTITPGVIARLEDSLTVDNMEALSVTREGGRTILWIASDDNYTPILQRTLLMKFALAL